MGSVFCADLTSFLNTDTGLLSVAPPLTVLLHLTKCMFDVEL